LQPAQHGRDERHAVAVGAVRDQVEIDLVALGNLPPEIVERHQQPGGEHISLMLDLAVFAVPADDILFTAPYALRVGEPVNQIVPEFVPRREIDASFRRDRAVVENPPAYLAGVRAIERTVKAGQGAADHQRHRIIGVALRAVLFMCRQGSFYEFGFLDDPLDVNLGRAFITIVEHSI
jgi:hypothetical protein